MKKLGGQLLSQFVLLFFLFLSVNPVANAVTRTIYFTQIGRNVTTEGLGTRARSTCRVTLSNPSGVSQSYSMSLTVSLGTGSTSTGSVSAPSGDAGMTCAGTGPYTCTGTLAAGSSHTKTFQYLEYPTAAEGTTAGFQILQCYGSVTANDPGANPGFMIASGSLTTFTESGAIQTQNNSGGASYFGGQAIFTQIPVSINRGKPF